MKNLFKSLLLVATIFGLSFSSATADDFEVAVGDNIIYSISGDKFIVEVISVKAEGKLFTAETEIEGKHYMFIFESMPENIFNVVMLENKKYSANRYYKKKGDFYIKYYLEEDVFSSPKNYFIQI